jgi:hypothetical protein
VYTFEFNGREKFPPIESLAFSGYRLDEDEWPYWREGLNWDKLRSLSLGPDPIEKGGKTSTSLLRYFRGYATSLRSLRVQTWAGEGSETCRVLEKFLASFDTLEELTVKRHFVPVQALTTHSRLKRLCLHCMEVKKPEGAVRPTLDVGGLGLLDASCRELETLEIDISRDKESQFVS